MKSLAAEMNNVITIPPADGKSWDWSALLHEVRLRDSRYVAWWEALPDKTRATYQADLDALVAEEERKAAEREAANKAKQQEETGRRLLERGIPRKDIELIASGALWPTNALKAAQDWFQSKKSILVLSGPGGCGKTSAASWLAAEAVAALFIDVTRLARLSRYKSSDMEPLERAWLLVIDDLGVEFCDTKGSFLATLDGLINCRYANQDRTVITTNLPATAFKQRYGERVVDRIREVGRFFECSGPSLRVRQ